MTGSIGNETTGSLRLGVYTGNPVLFATLTPVAVSGTSPYSFRVQPGTMYFLAWDMVADTRDFMFGGTFTPTCRPVREPRSVNTTFEKG